MQQRAAQPLSPAELRQQVFGAARDYHAAVARYARALLLRGGLESAAQGVVGTSLRYQAALERLLRHAAGDPVVAIGERLRHLRLALEAASRQYDALRRSRLRAAASLGPDL